MKYFPAIFIICLFVLPATIAAQGFLEPQEDIKKKEYVDQYFDRCMEIPDKNQSEESQADMCLCQTAYMSEHLTADEIEIMATGKGSGYVRKDVLFQDVYAPCLEFPAREMALDQCYKDKQVIALVTTQNAYESTCRCVAKDTVSYFRDLAQPQIAVLMDANPLLEDPLGAIMGSLEYTASFRKSIEQCLNTYQIEWDEYYRKNKEKFNK